MAMQLKKWVVFGRCSQGEEVNRSLVTTGALLTQFSPVNWPT